MISSNREIANEIIALLLKKLTAIEDDNWEKQNEAVWKSFIV